MLVFNGFYVIRFLPYLALRNNEHKTCLSSFSKNLSSCQIRILFSPKHCLNVRGQIFKDFCLHPEYDLVGEKPLKKNFYSSIFNTCTSTVR